MLQLWRAIPQAKADISRLRNGNSFSSHQLSWLQRHHHHHHHHHHHQQQQQHRLSTLGFPPSKPSKRNKDQGVCRAQVFEDVPFVIAIGVCVLSSLVYIKKDETKDGIPKRSSLGTDDMRDGAMTLISFVPIFNWLCWVFAWLDTSEQRYLLYASVYLAPYIRSGFSFSSDENWLLVLSYAACIAHVQMEIGIQTGSIEVNMDVLKRFGKTERKTIFPPKEELQNPMFDQDLSEMELSEFDKKLSRLRGDATTPVTDSSQEEKDIVEEDTESSGE